MLDFSIHSDVDRVANVEAELSTLHKSPTQAQLETMANFILFGKDANNLNAVDRGEVQIATKYASYARRKTESLDELTESPTFNETDVHPIARSIYTSPKPTLNKSLPQMQPLLQAIALQEDAIEHLESLPQTSATQTALYNANHLLIQLRKDQYALQDAIVQPLRLLSFNKEPADPFPDSMCDNIGPLGCRMGATLRFDDPKNDPSRAQPTDLWDASRPGIDLENPTHIYAILENWESLYRRSYDNPFTNAKWLLETLDFFIDATQFDDTRLTILNMKKQRYPNSTIREVLGERFGLTYSENYISTIYTKEICKKIAQTVTLHKDRWLARHQPSAWKRCACCGKWRLRDPREFIRKQSSDDGYTSRCKVCDREKKLEKKRAKQKAEREARKAAKSPNTSMASTTFFEKATPTAFGAPTTFASIEAANIYAEALNSTLAVASTLAEGLAQAATTTMVCGSSAI